MALAEDVHLLPDSAEYDSQADAEKAAKEAYRTHLGDVSREVSDCTFALGDIDTGSNSYTFTLTCANAAVRIETKISMDLECPATQHQKQPITLPNGTTKEVIKYTAKVSKASHNYNTYTITHLTAEGGASG